MQTVCELTSFRKAAMRCGMSEGEVAALTTLLANNPMAGDEIPGTGGCRKLRLGDGTKGKRGGYRVVTFFTGRQMPVFLVTVFAKGAKVNLTPAERADLKKITAQIVATYRSRIVPARTGSLK